MAWNLGCVKFLIGLSLVSWERWVRGIEEARKVGAVGLEVGAMYVHRYAVRGWGGRGPGVRLRRHPRLLTFTATR